MRYKILVLALFLGLILVGPKVNAQMFHDLNALGISGSDDGITGIYDQWGIYARSIINIDLGADGQFSSGDVFTINGLFKSGTLIDFTGGAIGDDEGLNSKYEITGVWNNLTGEITYVSPAISFPGATDDWYLATFSYDPGTRFTVYVDDTPDFDSSYDSNAATFTNLASASDGIPILDIETTGGSGSIILVDYGRDGTIDTMQNGSLTLNGKIVKVYEENFMFIYGKDFYDLWQAGKNIFATLDGNLDNFEKIGDPSANYWKSDTNGSVDFTVPEPATIVLMGSALLGIGSILRRKTKKN
ncbi:flocculation-associated PEP-CTERM protein PepA [Thermodesulfatator atlanticus]|uniref:flocculation-associated PEP-CTERM protein PepA n=1 Tax=Thermodesulfatator atlanticus TaxID=501497 RepID=UPI0003B43313|nr:flocculation-associated PEP-CTERM protein PepA [Thermodesulfatator atlanticus]